MLFFAEANLRDWWDVIRQNTDTDQAGIGKAEMMEWRKRRLKRKFIGKRVEGEEESESGVERDRIAKGGGNEEVKA